MWTPESRALVGDYGAGQALTDDQWRLLQPLIPPAKPGGRPRTTDMRRMLDKGTDWNDYEASHGQAATRAALRTAGLQELAAQDERVAARAHAAERQGMGLVA